MLNPRKPGRTLFSSAQLDGVCPPCLILQFFQRDPVEKKVPGVAVVAGSYRGVCHLSQDQSARPPTDLPAPPQQAESEYNVPFPNAAFPGGGRVGLNCQLEGTEQMAWTHLGVSLQTLK
jgi:hypothetical protein